jgi:hypothetical protein
LVYVALVALVWVALALKGYVPVGQARVPTGYREGKRGLNMEGEVGKGGLSRVRARLGGRRVQLRAPPTARANRGGRQGVGGVFTPPPGQAYPGGQGRHTPGER